MKIHNQQNNWLPLADRLTMNSTIFNRRTWLAMSAVWLSSTRLVSVSQGSTKSPNALPDQEIRARLRPPAGKISIVLDTDAYNEVDDAFAIAYALRSPDRLDLEAIYAAPFLNERSTGPSDGMEKSYQEILRVLGLLDRSHEGFAFRGSKSFLRFPDEPIESPAARDLVSRAMRERPQPLYVVGLGAATNIASAILLEPKIIEQIVVLWIGAQPYYWPTTRDFNLGQDLHAARLLFDSGVPLINIPALNVSEHLRTSLLEPEFFLEGKSKIGSYLTETVRKFYQASNEYKDHKGPQPYPYSKVIWDIATIGFLVNAEWVPSEVVSSPILTAEGTWQRDDSRHPVRVATHVMRDPIYLDLFAKLAR